jgi:hypothetical protein
MSDKITRLDTITTNNIPVDVVLEGAAKQDFQEVIVIGVFPDGERYYACSNANAAKVVMELELFKLATLEEFME